MANEKPCIYRHTCGFEYCNMTDCPYYEPKTKGRKWWEKQENDDGNRKVYCPWIYGMGQNTKGRRWFSGYKNYRTTQ